MSAKSIVMAAAGGTATQTYVDGVFSTYLYTGNGATQTITNGIDLAGQGGMVWTKRRSAAVDHDVRDSERGFGTSRLGTNLTSGVTTAGTTFTASSTGYQIVNSDAGGTSNASGEIYASWTFRKAPKFFDVVTYTGDGVAGRTIPHSLGVAPGMMIVKKTSATSSWFVYHRSLGGTKALILETTAAADTSIFYWNNTDPTASVFSIGGGASNINTVGTTFVAYLFAHDTATDGLIQCGSFTTNASGNATVSLGWEPQFVLTKRTDNVSNWVMLDTARGFNQTGTVQLLSNTSGAEVSITNTATPTATGFALRNSWGAGSAAYVYLAIRRPNKPPTSGTQVYNAIARAGNNAATTVTGVGFAPDLVLSKAVNDTGADGPGMLDRLRGPNIGLATSSTAAERTGSLGLVSFANDGVNLTFDAYAVTNTTGGTYSTRFFKRAPGVFDIVCYTGAGVAKTEAHNLGVVPELMIVKTRSIANNWVVYSGFTDNTKALFLNTTGTPTTNTAYWNDTSPSSSVFTVGISGNTNISAGPYVAYLFATAAGISKVGNYTGNGSSQTINCGFAAGARFVMIKRTDAAGDWYVWDTVRGIVAANDPHLSLNTTAVEVTTNDSIDPDSTGFIVNQVAATNINVTSATYIYLSFS